MQLFSLHTTYHYTQLITTHNLSLYTTYHYTQLITIHNLSLYTTYHYTQLITTHNLSLHTTYHYTQLITIVHAHERTHHSRESYNLRVLMYIVTHIKQIMRPIQVYEVGCCTVYDNVYRRQNRSFEGFLTLQVENPADHSKQPPTRSQTLTFMLVMM